MKLSPTTPTLGAGVYVLSDFDQNDRLLKVGNGLASGSSNGTNLFTKSVYGIYSEGEMNFDINKNTFGSSASDANRLRLYSIGIKRSGNKTVKIENVNKFYDYTYGIWLQNNVDYKELLIKNNDFFNHYAGSIPTSSNKQYYGTAISAINYLPTLLSNAEISENTIGLSTNSDQPRIGIRLSSSSNIKIFQNEISFHIGTASDQYRGIWATNCNDLKLDLNSVINHNAFTANNGDFLTGIRFENSNNSCIENSTLTSLGFGMRFEGTSIVQSLFQKTFTKFDEGIHLEDADIGATVGTENSPGDGNVMGNIWNLCTGCTLTTKVVGTISNPLKWYTDEPSGGDKHPDNNVTGLNIIQLSTYTESSECLLSSFEVDDYGNTMSLLKRNESYGSIVADSARYPEAYHEEFRYLARESVFKILRKHPALILKDDDSDTSFVSFYNGLLGSNMHKIDSLEKLILEGSYAAADTLLNYFATSNTVDYNYKKVYRVAIKVLLYGDTSITSGEKDELNEIAHQHPLLGGFGVYIARNLLHLEIYDENLSSERIMQPKVEIRRREMTIYPNPANEYVILQLSDQANIDEIKIVDITGRVCINYYSSSLISTTTLAPGIYYVNAQSNGEQFNASFIVNH